MWKVQVQTAVSGIAAIKRTFAFSKSGPTQKGKQTARKVPTNSLAVERGVAFFGFFLEGGYWLITLNMLTLLVKGKDNEMHFTDPII